MASQAATSLKDQLTQKMKELDEALNAIDEAKAGRQAAEGAWSCNELLSHLVGEESVGFVTGLKRFLDEDTPLVDVVPGVSYYTAKRQAMSLAELRRAVDQEYAKIAELVGGLSDEQLARTAHIPLLNETPFGEYPTLAQWTTAIIGFHLTDHVNQIKQMAQA